MALRLAAKNARSNRSAFQLPPKQQPEIRFAVRSANQVDFEPSAPMFTIVAACNMPNQTPNQAPNATDGNYGARDINFDVCGTRSFLGFETTPAH